MTSYCILSYLFAFDIILLTIYAPETADYELGTRQKLIQFWSEKHGRCILALKSIA